VFERLPYAFCLVIGTTLIHAAFTAAGIGWLRSMTQDRWELRSSVTRACVLALLVFGMSIAAWAEAALWACAYWWLGALQSFGEALYFSLVTFTTLGYGDVTLPPRWRMLGAVEAANGTIMFGWTTALIVALAQRLFSLREKDASASASRSL